jgi:hypothetical protein
VTSALQSACYRLEPERIETALGIVAVIDDPVALSVLSNAILAQEMVPF